MKRWASALILLFLLVAIGCKKGDENTETKVVPVSVFKVHPDSISAFVDVTANLEAGHDALVVSKTSERLVEILKPVGSTVKENEVIARLNDRMLLQVKNQAQAGLQSARARYENVKNDYERYRKLYEAKAISIQQWQKMQSALQEAQAGLQQMEAAFAQAKEQYDNCLVRAPFNGVVGSFYFEPGQMVPMGQPVAKIINPRLMKAKLYVPDVYFGKLRIGQRVVATFPVLPGRKFVGKIVRIDPAIDPMSRTILAEVSFENKDQSLTSGLYGNFHIQIERRTNTLVVPDNAILTRTEVKVNPETGETFSLRKHFVFVVTDSSIARLVRIRKGLAYGDRVEVLKGLKSGDQIIIVGQFSLKDGEKVRIVQD